MKGRTLTLTTNSACRSDHQRRASATHHVAAAGGDFPDCRAEFGTGRITDYLRREFFFPACPRAQMASCRADFSDARSLGRQFHQRPEVRARPAGIVTAIAWQSSAAQSAQREGKPSITQESKAPSPVFCADKNYRHETKLKRNGCTRIEPNAFG